MAVELAPGFGLGFLFGAESGSMDKLEIVRLAIRELGDVPAEELAGFIEQRHGVKIEPKFIPIFKASLRDKLRLDAARQEARAAIEQAKAEPPAA